MQKKHKQPSVASAPFIRKLETVTTLMIDVLIALLPVLIFEIYRFGFTVLLMCMISAASCLVFDFAVCAITKRVSTASLLSSAVTGVILSLTVSPFAPLWVLPLGAFIAIVIVKQLFGGLGKNILNPAATARILLSLGFGSQVDMFFTADGAPSETVLTLISRGEMPGIELGDMFLGIGEQAIGAISAAMLLICVAYLLFRRAANARALVAFIVVFAVLSYLFPEGEIPKTVFMLFSLLSGYALFAAVFMTSDTVTTPVTKTGRLIFGVGMAVLTFLARRADFLDGIIGVDGVFIAIIIMNLLTPLIDRYINPKPFGAFKAQSEQSVNEKTSEDADGKTA